MDYNKFTNIIYHHDFSVSALRDIAAGEEFLHGHCQWPTKNAQINK
jgi:hypothetical protein